MVRAHGSGRMTARNNLFLGKFLPLGEKTIEEPLLILPSEKQCDNITKVPPVMPPTKPDSVIPEAPHDTPNPPLIPIRDVTEYPTVNVSPTLTQGTAKDIAIPGPAPVAH